MFRKQVLAALIAAWPICVLVTLAARGVMGIAPISPSEYLGWMFFASGLAAVAMLILRETSATGQVLSDAGHAAGASTQAGRARLRGDHR